MKITLLDIGLFLICLFYSYAILEFVQRREKYSILLGGNFIIGLFLFVILHAPIVYILKVLGIGLAAAMVLPVLYFFSEIPSNLFVVQQPLPPLIV